MEARKRRIAKVFAAVLVLGVLGLGSLWYLHRQGTAVPVLMYHHFVEQGPAGADTVVSAPRFEEQMQALRDGGYTAITPEQLIDYVDGKGQLPPKPVLITMDDGYTSNLDIAAPILEKYGMRATIFTIGINVGQTVYPHSQKALDPPRFSWEQARPWVDKGVICVQSHTYDMHQRIAYGFSGRDGVLQKVGEREDAYRLALREDFTRARDGLREGLGVEMRALAFPFGLNSPEAVEELSQLGVRVTLTTCGGCRRVVPGVEQSIQCMERLGVNDQMTGEDLLQAMERVEMLSKAKLF